MSDQHDITGRGLGRLLDGVDARVGELLAASLDGRDLSVDDAVTLCGSKGASLHALCLVADELRRQQAGDVVTYVVNRNINFTNVCVKACRFCAFARGHRSEQSYFLDVEEVVRRALEAQALGATEVCIQAGLAPGMDGRLYVQLTRALKAAAPDLAIHAFSPEEVKYGAGLAGISISDYLAELKDAGLGSLPGTSAEILDDDLRARIAPGRITVAEWLEVIRSAHALAIPTTSTLMFGHIETDGERMRHLALLRDVQRETHGFTELVPLSFVHHEAPMFLKAQLPDLRPGPTGNEVVRLFAIARLMLGRDIPNLQASWVKEGLRSAQHLLSCGANDLGGTLMNESISTSAGAGHGQFIAPSELRTAIRDAGRVPAERDTRYRLLKTFDGSFVEELEPLDRVDDPEATFGTYATLSADPRVRFKKTRPSEHKSSA